MEAILQATVTGRINNVIPKIVISSNPKAEGLEKAANYGVPTKVVSNSAKGREFDKEIATILNNHLINSDNGLVCLAGYMRIIGPEFINLFRMRILNIHPSLLPSFPGLHAQRQALDYGVKVSGCTVHFVDAGVDTGPIIGQSTVRVEENDTEETLSERILAREHELYVDSIKKFADGRLSVRGRRVFISP